MNPIATQILFEARVHSFVPLAICTPWGESIGAGTEAAGCRAMQFFDGILRTAGVETSPAGLIYAECGPVVMLAVSDESKALSEIWHALSRFGIEDSSWVAKWDVSTWRDLFPVRGVARELPPEITLLPPEIYRLEDELRQLQQRNDELGDGLRLGTVTEEDFEAQTAIFNERMQGVSTALAEWKAKLTGGQS